MALKYIVKHKVTAEIFGTFENRAQFTLCLPVYGLNGSGYFDPPTDGKGVDSIMICGQPYVGITINDAVLSHDSYSMVVIKGGGEMTSYGRFLDMSVVKNFLRYAKSKGWDPSHMLVWSNDSNGRIVNMQRVDIVGGFHEQD